MRYYHPCATKEWRVHPALQGLKPPPKPSPQSHVLSKGSAVLLDEKVAERMMTEHLGGCLVLELSDEYVSTGATTAWGWDWGWRTLLHDAPIAGWRHADEEEILIARTEALMIGVGLPSLQELAEICRPDGETPPNLVLRPEERALRTFRLVHGRAPNLDELRRMMK